MAIRAWQVATKPTASVMLLANHPLIKLAYQLLHARSAYSRYADGLYTQVFQLVHDAHANNKKNESRAIRGHLIAVTSCSNAIRLETTSNKTYV